MLTGGTSLRDASTGLREEGVVTGDGARLIHVCGHGTILSQVGDASKAMLVLILLPYNIACPKYSSGQGKLKRARSPVCPWQHL